VLLLPVKHGICLCGDEFVGELDDLECDIECPEKAGASRCRPPD
jgi:hypothetical protein